MSQISGNTAGLGHLQRKRLKKIALSRVRGDILVSQEFARSLCNLSFEIGRQIGVLIGRNGYVRHVMVGDRHSIMVPQLEHHPQNCDAPFALHSILP